MEYTFTKKQVGVVYKAWKQGKVEIEKQTVNKIYDLAENGISGYSRSCFCMNHAIKKAVSLILKGRYEEAQKQLDYFAHNLRHYEWVQKVNAEGAAKIRALRAAEQVATA